MDVNRPAASARIQAPIGTSKPQKGKSRAGTCKVVSPPGFRVYRLLLSVGWGPAGRKVMRLSGS